LLALFQRDRWARHAFDRHATSKQGRGGILICDRIAKLSERQASAAAVHGMPFLSTCRQPRTCSRDEMDCGGVSKPGLWIYVAAPSSRGSDDMFQAGPPCRIRSGGVFLPGLSTWESDDAIKYHRHLAFRTKLRVLVMHSVKKLEVPLLTHRVQTLCLYEERVAEAAC